MQMGNPIKGLPIFKISAIFIPAKWFDITIRTDTEFVFMKVKTYEQTDRTIKFK